jgi:hypothetical protein
MQRLNLNPQEPAWSLEKLIRWDQVFPIPISWYLAPVQSKEPSVMLQTHGPQEIFVQVYGAQRTQKTFVEIYWA